MDTLKATDWLEYELGHRAMRSLWRSDVTDPLAQAQVLAVVSRRLDELADAKARVAVVAGESYSAVGLALGVSRQAARKRYGNLRRREVIALAR